MKIHQLPDGARFHYEGETYVKTGPLFATGPQGQRLIPKYAILTPLDAVPHVPGNATKHTLTQPAVAAAFAAFYTQCQSLVPESQQAGLAQARAEFLKAIGG